MEQEGRRHHPMQVISTRSTPAAAPGRSAAGLLLRSPGSRRQVTRTFMETRTHLFTFPIETDSDRAAVEEALEKLSAELELTHALRLKGGHRAMITIPDVDPEATWSAIDRAVPDWQRLFLPPSAP
jgi:hypothetical protein